MERVMGIEPNEHQIPRFLRKYSYHTDQFADPKSLPKRWKPDEDARVKRVRPALIGLLGSRIGATILDRCDQLGNKLIDQSALLIGKVVFFCRIIIQIVELHQRKVLVLQCRPWAWDTPAAGTGAKRKLPRAAPDGKGAID